MAVCLLGAGAPLLGRGQGLGGAGAPGVELLWVHPVLPAPGAAGGFVHGRRGDHRAQPGRVSRHFSGCFADLP